MKKFTVLMLCFFALFLTACQKEKQPTLDFENKQINVLVGEEFTLTPKITNLKGSDLVDYVIGDNTILSLTNGKFVALKSGQTTITATLKDDTDISVVVNVTVTETEYTITYNLNGGTNPTSAPAKFVGSNLPLTLPVPTKSGNTFLGWFESSDFTGTAVLSIAVGTKANKVYYAKWQEVDYTITYHLDGGSLDALAPTGFNASTLPLTLPVPTKTGYTFLGWFESSDFAGNAVTTIAAGTNENKQYYAKWEIVNYTISYELNEGTNAQNAPTSYNVGQLPLTLPTPTRSGYQFVGWYDNAELTGNQVTQIEAGSTGNKTYYAKWIVLVTYSFTYELNGGTNSTSNLASYTTLQLPLTLTEPTKDGYVFAGWYLNSDFSGDVVTIVEIAKNYTLYAKWDVLTPDVYVNSALVGTESGKTVSYKGVNYKFGVNAFATLSEGLNAATGKVYVVGSHSENVTITKSDLTILGPNANVDPNTGERIEEAIITGTITIASEVKNITINGLAFTGNGKVTGTGNITNLQFIYNNVYDTTEASTAWKETAGYTTGFFVFQNTVVGKEFVDFTIFNNKFSNVSDVNLNFARIKNVKVEGNTFNNFDRDAIRFDTGGFNHGELTFINNEFINDTLSGNNGIFFRIYGGDQNLPTTITIERNTFKNIGQTDVVSYSGAISMRNYQEKDTTIIIQFNTFETCANYIHVRNNAVVSNHTSYPWKANVNYNIFKGIPTTYYHKNWTGTDGGTNNPVKMNFEYNYFEDHNGNPITDLSTHSNKLLQVESYAHNLQSKADYDQLLRQLKAGSIDMYVNAAWSSKTVTEEFNYLGKTLTFGINAFSSLAEAISSSIPGNTIYVLPGTYVDNVTIMASDLNIVTDNMDVNPNKETRYEEAIVTGVFTVNNGIQNLTINGLAFTDTAKVTGTGNISNVQFVNNYVYDTTEATTAWKELPGYTTGFFVFQNTVVGNEFVDFKVMNNKFSNVSDVNLNFARIKNVTVEGNSFRNFDRDAIRFDTGGFNRGELTFINNEFVNDTLSGNNGIFFRIYGGDQTLPTTITIERNTFKNIGQTANLSYSGAISMRNYQEKDTTIVVQFNTFETCANYIHVRNNATVSNHTTYPLSTRVNYNYFKGIPTTYYHKNWTGSDGGTSNPIKMNFEYNYFEDNDGNPITDLSSYASKLLQVTSYANNYQTKEAYDQMIKELVTDVVLPTQITIDNPVNELEELADYQLDVTVSPNRSANKNVIYSSSDSNIIEVSATGLITAKASGTATITITSAADETVFTTITITVVERARIEVTYEGNGALEIGQSLQLESIIYPTNTGTVVWSSSDESVATVDQNGIVTAVSSGTVIITATIGDLQTQVGLTVYGAEVTDDLLKYLISINTGVLTTQELYYIGSDDGSADYLNRIYNSVSDYQFSSFTINRDYMIPEGRDNYSGVNMSSIEFITVHDTAGSRTTSTAKANAGWATNTDNPASWHYTTGNDGVYQHLEDTMKAYHAGDGSRSFGLNDTGIVATIDKPVITINESGMFVLNGVVSTIQAPAIAPITPTGIYTTIGENGNYWMNNTYHNTGYNVIANAGGNMNSIGIESAVNNGSDVFLTWQTTAKLSAQLAVTHNLEIDRILFHNNFSGKPCPRTMLTAGLQEEFYDLVEAEYNIQKNYSDYTITVVSNNPDIIDNTGRVIGRPLYTTNVTYTITVTKGEFSQSITLNSLVPGQYNY